MNNLNCALLLVGQMRTFDSKEIQESYLKYLNNMGILFPNSMENYNKTNKIDLYICTWNIKGHSNHHNNINFDYEYTNDIITKENLYKHYQQFPFFRIMQIQINCWDEWYSNLSDEYKHIYNKPFDNNPNNNTSVPAEFIYQQAINMLPDDSDYDRVIFLRPDMQLLEEFPIKVTDDPNTIYWQCICKECIDHSWFTSQKTMIKFLVFVKKKMMNLLINKL